MIKQTEEALPFRADQSAVQDVKNRLCMWGEYCNRSLETEYLQSSLNTKKRSLYPVLAILTAVFSLFLIPDVLANAGNPRLGLILAIRITVILWLALLFPILAKVQTPKTFSQILGFSQGIVGMTFLYVSSLYSSPDFSLQILALAMLILSFFALPCSLKDISFVSVVVWSFFLFLASRRFPDSAGKEWLVAILFPMLFLLVALSFRLRIEQEQRKMYLMQKQLERLSEMDPLTGAANRYRFDRELDVAFKDFKYKAHAVSLILMDVDRFKAVNDRFGHQTGDLILVGLCGVFRTLLREQDLLVRWGGEEFAILLPDTDESGAAALAGRLRAELEKKLFTAENLLPEPGADTAQWHKAQNGTRKREFTAVTGEVPVGITITGSFGVAQVKPDDSEKSLVARADSRMYRAKELGRNRVVSGDQE